MEGGEWLAALAREEEEEEEEDSGTLMGVVRVCEGHFGPLAVHPHAQGRGVGSALLRAAEEYACEAVRCCPSPVYCTHKYTHSHTTVIRENIWMCTHARKRAVGGCVRSL